MIKEQEAIEIINNMIKSYTEADECGLSNNDFKHEIKAMETVLNMLKEKDKEIDKKNEIIDELVKYIDSNNYVDNEECQFQWDFKIEKCAGNGDCKDCIKQYFEKLAKEKGE